MPKATDQGPAAEKLGGQKTKIERSLTPEELQEFLAKAVKLKGGLLRDIQALAAEYGIEVSLMGARSFKRGPFADYLDELRRKREMAESVSEVARDGLGLADAAAVALSKKIFDDLVNGEDVSLRDKNTYSLALSRLRTGDQRSRFLEAKLQEMQQKIELQQFDAAAAAITHAKSIRAVMGDKSIDERARTEKVRQILFGAAPAGFTPVTTTGDAR